jgi:hypothetical protein
VKNGKAVPVVLGLLAVLAAACSDDSTSGADGGSDAGTDTDTDTDVDTDADGGPDGGGFACEVDSDRIFADVAYFASDELAGRMSGGEGNELALQTGEALFAALGLEPVGDEGTFRQAFDVETWSLSEEPTVSIDGSALTEGSDYAVFSYSGAAAVTAEIVYVGYGMTVPAYDPADYPDCPLPATGYDDYAGVDVTGKVALVVRHGPADDTTVPDTCPDDGLCGGAACLWNFTYKAANAALHGAAAMIVVQNYANGPGILDGASMSGGYVDDLASLFVDRDVVAASLPDLETWTDGIDGALAPDPHATGVEAAIDVAAAVATVPTANLLGAIPGTDPAIGDEVVIVGGHIDHLGSDGATIYYGADDNASGASVTMELARLAANCANPARTVVFALWNGEEEGLLGSVHYVQNPVYPLGSTIAAFSVDMVGAGSESTLVLYGATDDQNAWLAQVMQGSAPEMGYDWSVSEGAGLGASDDYPFSYVGIPAVCAMSGVLALHPYYHTPNDTPANILPGALEMSASMMWAGLKPIIEGTEELYLTSGKALLDGRAPVPPVDPNSRLYRNR